MCAPLHPEHMARVHWCPQSRRAGRGSSRKKTRRKKKKKNSFIFVKIYVETLTWHMGTTIARSLFEVAASLHWLTCSCSCAPSNAMQQSTWCSLSVYLSLSWLSHSSTSDLPKPTPCSGPASFLPRSDSTKTTKSSGSSAPPPQNPRKRFRCLIRKFFLV